MRDILSIMIVDNDIIAMAKIKEFIINSSCNNCITVNEAYDLNQVYIKLKKHFIDVFIITLEMDTNKVLSIIENINKRKLCNCVIVLSNYNDYRNVRSAFIHGAFDYLTKPVQQKSLEDTLKRAKNYIMEKEKNDTFYRFSDIDNISELLIQCNKNTSSVIFGIVRRISLFFDFNVEKMELYLRHFILLVISSTNKKCSWLKNFIIVDEWIEIDFRVFKNYIGSKTTVDKITDKAISDLKMLTLIHYNDELINRITECVLINIDKGVTLEFIADKLFMNKNYLSQAFKKKTGISFSRYLKSVKMRRAKKLFYEHNYKVYEISQILGYKDVDYFSSLYKDYKKKFKKIFFKLLI